ncbi:DUF4185 domain-containing protein [Allomuricauda sp. CP2A]|jgi:hypothetical protein|uniref:DUF4185 domain-containing protein n=1 Tax=Allomuricauda sp. CP2A TaxID=1848189 RepID=UPI0009F1D795|nr:DUF4185 domain-containing protein [Muricauda sp. CP2A]
MTYRKWIKSILKTAFPVFLLLGFKAHCHPAGLGIYQSSSVSLQPNSNKHLKVISCERLARVTGASVKGEVFANPNVTHQKYNVGGTDLGIFWKMDNGKVGCFFGDTYGSDFKASPNGGPSGGSWRSNVLAFSTDSNLDDGLTFSSMLSDPDGHAREVIPSAHDTTGTGDWTSIPTAAVSVAGTEYVHYMNIRSWDSPGEWTTNYSSMYQSNDGGHSWSKIEDVHFKGDSKFAQMAFAKRNGMVYMVGTKSGRKGPAYLARVNMEDFPNPSKFEYLGTKKNWFKGGESLAQPIFSAPVGEISILYNETFKLWITLYTRHSNEDQKLVMRTTEHINGTWSDEKIIADPETYPIMYGSFMHPKSISGSDIYFAMSMWQPYNVFLMKASLELEN